MPGNIRKQKITKLDDFLNQNCTEEEIEEVLAFLKLPNFNGLDLYRYVCGLGYTGSPTSVYTWIRQKATVGARATEINNTLADYEGLDTAGLLSKLAGVLTNQLTTTIETINATPKDKIPPSQYLAMLPSITKELRATIDTINKTNYITDRKGLEMSGAIMLAQLLERTFKDAPFYEPLREGIIGCVLEIEEKQ